MRRFSGNAVEYLDSRPFPTGEVPRVPAAMHPRYALADAEELKALLQPLALVGERSSEHGFMFQNGASSPWRLAYAEHADLVYEFGKDNLTTPPKAAWVDDPARSANEQALCRVLRRVAAELSDKTQLATSGHHFNYVLVQRYTADEYLSWHRDEPAPRNKVGLAAGTPVGSVSLGANRVFAFTDDAYDEERAHRQYGLVLQDGDLVVMQAACHKRQNAGGFAHALLRSSSGASCGAVGVRFNLTFRVMQSARA
jgi:alkylated DNA repair dioxygenase AlkB